MEFDEVALLREKLREVSAQRDALDEIVRVCKEAHGEVVGERNALRVECEVLHVENADLREKLREFESLVENLHGVVNKT